MLKTTEGIAIPPELAGTPQATPPGLDNPFLVGERPYGVRFYQVKRCFYLPYPQLLSMDSTGERLVLDFGGDSIEICGHGLHSLFHFLSTQEVQSVVEQGDMGLAATTHVRTIRRIPKANRGGEAAVVQ